MDITRKVGKAGTLSESVILCATTEKDYYLFYFVKSHPCRTRFPIMSSSVRSSVLRTWTGSLPARTGS